MKNYGNVKGRKYYTEQPLAKTPGKQLCPRCRKSKPHRDFIGANNLPRKACSECRRRERERKQERKRNDTKDMR